LKFRLVCRGIGRWNRPISASGAGPVMRLRCGGVRVADASFELPKDLG
jgi:hypothetical protein